MPSFLVEAYLPTSRADEVRAGGLRARIAAEQLAAEGVPLRYVRTMYLPQDETCFHVFEAATSTDVEEVSRRAALGATRIVAVQEQTW